MKIGIDARMMGKGYGIGRYVEQLIKHLSQAASDMQFVLFVNSKILNTEYQISNIEFTKFKIIKTEIPWYSWEEQVDLTKIIKKEKIDLMHFPHWNVPIFYPDPFILTLHDLTMFHFPRPEATTLGPIKFWFKDKVHRLVIKSAAKKAKHIITASEFTRYDVHKTLKVPLEKMTTVYQEPLINSELRMSDEEVDLANFGISKPYVLYVGSAYPHKNLEGLLKAWKIFEDKYDNGYQLVLAGKEDHFYKNLKSKIINSKSVVTTGFVSDQELGLLYKKASLYVFPSLYEGFGLPPLEAMAHNVPVVSSNAACLPEVLGEGALYFDPTNHEEMAVVMWQGLTDQNVRFELKNRAKEELGRYSWERAAKQISDIYKKAL